MYEEYHNLFYKLTLLVIYGDFFLNLDRLHRNYVILCNKAQVFFLFVLLMENYQQKANSKQQKGKVLIFEIGHQIGNN